mmetsp:Transcript_24087/g.65212  ORF Transcript_24087/g.65212 Transcript_24087/m.65212 type:complete len:188 (+) Transcript_24087:1314-1877(+)
MHSTANLEASLLVTFVAYRWDVIQHLLFRIHMYENRSPYYAKREMTRTQYEDEGRDYTAQQLQKLREHLNQNSGDMWRLGHGRNQTEGFMRGNEHVVRTFPDARPSRLAGFGSLLLQAFLSTMVLAVSAMAVLDYNPLRDIDSAMPFPAAQDCALQNENLMACVEQDASACQPLMDALGRCQERRSG